MIISLDGQILFDEQGLEIQAGSFSRDSVERAVPGLDGVLSVDMGLRGRKIKQTGTLRAKSRSKMNDRIAWISACMDGDTHTLAAGDGRKYDNLRMDSFKVNGERIDGTGIVVDYEIIYTQLV
ncbi:MAG: hypothetical protein ABIF19_06390 [Planctomycetota bacterium]